MQLLFGQRMPLQRILHLVARFRISLAARACWLPWSPVIALTGHPCRHSPHSSPAFVADSTHATAGLQLQLRWRWPHLAGVLTAVGLAGSRPFRPYLFPPSKTILPAKLPFPRAWKHSKKRWRSWSYVIHRRRCCRKHRPAAPPSKQMFASPPPMTSQRQRR